VSSPCAGYRPRAVTFDFWNTLYAGTGAAETERRDRRVAMILAAVPSLDPRDGSCARRISRLMHDCTRIRAEGNRGLEAAERLAWVFGELGVELEPGALESLAREVAELGVEFPPRPLPGARELVEALARRHALGLVSDTGLTEGRFLRELLRADGLSPPIVAFGMSDETGWSKPAPGAFLPVLEALRVAPEETVHVGDTAATDIVGALSLGMRAVWIDTEGAGPDPALSELGTDANSRLRVVGSLAEVQGAVRGFEEDT
jgi:putative hydrolase of the HAD superfamily